MAGRAPALACALIVAGATAGLAGEADVVGVEVSRLSQGVYRFAVTVRHADEGWDHYADAFEILAPDGTVLGSGAEMSVDIPRE